MLTAVTIKVNVEDLALLRARGTNVSGMCREFLHTIANATTRCEVDLIKAQRKVEGLRKIAKEHVARLTVEEANLMSLQNAQRMREQQIQEKVEKNRQESITCCFCNKYFRQTQRKTKVISGNHAGRLSCGGRGTGCTKLHWDQHPEWFKAVRA